MTFYSLRHHHYHHAPLFFLSILVVLLSISTTTSAQAVPETKKIILKVNFGGGPVADFLGEDQVLDMSAFSKNIARVKIENTDHPEIFQSTRFARKKDMSFRIPVPTGLYSITLLFAETFRPACTPGARVFDIAIGTPVSGVTKIVQDFDLFQSAGCLTAHGKRFDKVPSKDGIVIHLSHKFQHPSLCGFIAEGFPLPVGDGSEFKAVGRLEKQAVGYSHGNDSVDTDNVQVPSRPFGTPIVASRRRILSVIENMKRQFVADEEEEEEGLIS